MAYPLEWPARQCPHTNNMARKCLQAGHVLPTRLASWTMSPYQQFCKEMLASWSCHNHLTGQLENVPIPTVLQGNVCKLVMSYPLDWPARQCPHTNNMARKCLQAGHVIPT